MAKMATRASPTGILKCPGEITKRNPNSVSFHDRKQIRIIRKRTDKSKSSRNSTAQLTKLALRVAKSSRISASASGRIVVDSGATAHLIKNKKWIGRLLLNRHKLKVRDAVGKAHYTGTHGDLRMKVKRRDGTV
mmetsp:Transcript_27136/g.37273  ORF Transcript_27136/g.37273 Transcript_27136/m.37273 type:complete len:134 (-) Transcript_27136:63-464(-)